jgi:hypothetical protein
MPASVKKQTYAVHQPMSALPPKANIAESNWHVRFVPKADMAARARCALFPRKWERSNVGSTKPRHEFCSYVSRIAKAF